MHRIKKPILLKLQVSKCFRSEMGPKLKKGEVKNGEVYYGVSRVFGLIPHLLAHNKDLKKNHLGIDEE